MTPLSPLGAAATATDVPTARPAGADAFATLLAGAVEADATTARSAVPRVAAGATVPAPPTDRGGPARPTTGADDDAAADDRPDDATISAASSPDIGVAAVQPPLAVALVAAVVPPSETADRVARARPEPSTGGAVAVADAGAGPAMAAIAMPHPSAGEGDISGRSPPDRAPRPTVGIGVSGASSPDRAPAVAVTVPSPSSGEDEVQPGPSSGTTPTTAGPVREPSLHPAVGMSVSGASSVTVTVPSPSSPPSSGEDEVQPDSSSGTTRTIAGHAWEASPHPPGRIGVSGASLRGAVSPVAVTIADLPPRLPADVGGPSERAARGIGRLVAGPAEGDEPPADASTAALLRHDAGTVGRPRPIAPDGIEPTSAAVPDGVARAVSPIAFGRSPAAGAMPGDPSSRRARPGVAGGDAMIPVEDDESRRAAAPAMPARPGGATPIAAAPTASVASAVERPIPAPSVRNDPDADVHSPAAPSATRSVARAGAAPPTTSPGDAGAGAADVFAPRASGLDLARTAYPTTDDRGAGALPSEMAPALALLRAMPGALPDRAAPSTLAILAARVLPGLGEAAGTADPTAPATDGMRPARNPDDPAPAIAPTEPPRPRVPDEAVVAPDATATLAAGATDRAIATARHAAWADGVARDIASVATEARFTVASDRLGAVHVAVRPGDGGADIRLTAGSEAARDLLADARPALVEQARAHGLHVREARVDVAASPAEAATPSPAAPQHSLTDGGYGGGGDGGRQPQHREAAPRWRPGAGTGGRAGDAVDDAGDGLYA